MADHHTHTPSTETAHAASEHGSHGHGDGNYLHHVRPYLLVGAALFVFTAITVGLSYVDFDHIFGGHGWNMIVGLSVASFKVCLVGAWFMHLKSERRDIWYPLIFTFLFCLALFLLFLLGYTDPIPWTRFSEH